MSGEIISIADFKDAARELGEEVGKGELVDAFIEETLHGPDGESWEKYHRWTEGLSPEQRKSMLEWEQETYGTRE